MSSYYSQSNTEIEDDQRPIFYFNNYLSNTSDVIDEGNDWKSNLHLPHLDYLEKEVQVIIHWENFIYSENQVRAIAFFQVLGESFKQAIQKYESTYAETNKEISEAIQSLDSTSLQLIKYLHLVLQNLSFLIFNERYSQQITEMNSYLKKILNYGVDMELLWYVLQTPGTYSEENKSNNVKVPFSASKNYYERELKLLAKKNVNLSKCLTHSKSKAELIEKIRAIINNTEIKSKMIYKSIALMKGQFYSEMESNELRSQFILQSFKMYYSVHCSEKISQPWDQQKYENLCLNILQQSLEDSQYLDYMLAMELENTDFARRHRVDEFISIYNRILDDLLSISKGEKLNYLLLPFVSSIIEENNANFFIYSVVNFLNSNKNVFSSSEVSLHRGFLSMIDKLKQLFLSMGSNCWAMPTTIFMSISNKFFQKLSEDLSPQILKLLPEMIKNICQNQLPKKVKIVSNENGRQLVYVPVSKQEYLSAIFGFIENFITTDNDIYIELPEIFPTDFETAILFIRSLQLRLKHHQPNQEQKNNYSMILDEITVRYKLNPKFSWYKNKNNFSVKNREEEYGIICSISEEWGRDLLQKLFNYRDEDKYNEMVEKLIESEIDLIYDMIPYLKYGIGISISPNQSRSYISEANLISLLDELGVFLSLDISNVIDPSPDEIITINYIHLCLMFYNTKIQQASDSSIYLQIVNKILIPWINSPNSKANVKFQQIFFQFFVGFITKGLEIMIEEATIQHVSKYKNDQEMNKDLTLKLEYLTQIFTKETVERIGFEKKVLILQEIFQILDSEMDVKILLQLCYLYQIFFETEPTLEHQFSLDYPVEFVIESEPKFTIFLELLSQWQSELFIVNFSKSIIKKMPEIYHKFSLKLIMKILTIYFKVESNLNPQEILSRRKLLYENFININKDGKSRASLFMIIPLITLKMKLEISNILAGIAENQKIEIVRINELEWNNLSDYLVQKNKENKQVLKDNFDSLENLIACFGDQVDSALEPEIGGEKNKSVESEIWKQVAQQYGTLQDILIVGADPSLYFSSANQSQLWTSLLIQNKIPPNLFKKLISKFPVVKQQAQKTVSLLSQEHQVNPQLIYKLMLINSKYQSSIVEQFIINNLQNFDASNSIKIYQDYIVKNIQKELASIPADFLTQILHEQNYGQLEKIHSIFNKILCLPIKKFENVKLKLGKEEKIEEVDGAEWETESEKVSDGEDEEESPELKTKKKKSKVQLEENSDEGSDDLNSNEQNFIDLEVANQGSMSEQQDYDNTDQLPIAQMFYTENSSSLPIYKKFIQLREQLNVVVEDNYSNSFQKYEHDPQFNSLVERMVTTLSQFPDLDIVKSIINKIPFHLYNALKVKGCPIEQNEEEIKNERKEETKKPHFTIQNEQSDRDSEQYYSDGEGDYDDESMSQESGSISNTDENYSNYQSQESYQKSIGLTEQKKQQVCISENFCEKEVCQQLPDLKEMTSKIEAELTGEEFTSEELIKIYEISILKLLFFSQSEIKSNACLSFYLSILSSNHRKIFVDSALTVLRIDENYELLSKYALQQQHKNIGISIRKGLNNLLLLLHREFSQNDSSSSNILKKISEEGGAMFPIADQIIIKNNIPVQDNILTLLIFYCKYKTKTIHEKLQYIIGQWKDIGYKLTKFKAKIITTHVFKNNTKSNIWNEIGEDRFQFKMDREVKFYCCLSVYGKLLRENLTKCIQGLESHSSSQFQSLPFHYREKVVENSLKVYSKRIKHYYFWNKMIVMQQQQEFQGKSRLKKVLKNQDLIKLTEMMMFYIYKIKSIFYGKSDEKTFSQIIAYPKSIIETSFLYMEKFGGTFQNLQPVSKVAQFFKAYKYGEFQFSRLDQACNLIVMFLEMPAFCSPRIKEVLIPYLMKNPEIAYDYPLQFKLPRIPEEPEGQKLYLTRECSFDMAFYELHSKAILVEFHEQEGSDHGGMIRELMMGWKGIGVGQEYFFLGKLFGISFKRGIPYGGTFDIAMSVAITNFTPTLEFFKQVDKHIYDSLVFIRDNDPEDLGLKFCITKEYYGVMKQHELKQNGNQIELMEQNKLEYIQLFIKKYYFAGREWELSELRAGFYSIVNKNYVAIFHPLELIQKIRGEEIDDYMKLKKKAKYEEGYTENSEMIKWLWEIISEFSQLDMNKFIQFLTGAPKVSIYDPNFVFVVEKMYSEGDSRLPVAHTCFNTLDLPEYPDKATLEKKLRQAIYQGNDNFGIM